MNKELIEQLKQGTHCIEMPDNPTKEDVKLLNSILEIVEGSNPLFEGINKYYGFNWDNSHNCFNRTTIPLSSFLDTPKMISVEAVKEWVDTQSKVYKAIPIDQLLTFLNTHTNVK